MALSFEQLKSVADTVGVGYAELEEEALRTKLLHEGAP